MNSVAATATAAMHLLDGPLITARENQRNCEEAEPQISVIPNIEQQHSTNIGFTKSSTIKNMTTKTNCSKLGNLESLLQTTKVQQMALQKSYSPPILVAPDNGSSDDDINNNTTFDSDTAQDGATIEKTTINNRSCESNMENDPSFRDILTTTSNNKSSNNCLMTSLNTRINPRLLPGNDLTDERKTNSAPPVVLSSPTSMIIFNPGRQNLDQNELNFQKTHSNGSAIPNVNFSSSSLHNPNSEQCSLPPIIDLGTIPGLSLNDVCLGTGEFIPVSDTSQEPYRQGRRESSLMCDEFEQYQQNHENDVTILGVTDSSQYFPGESQLQFQAREYNANQKSPQMDQFAVEDNAPIEQSHHSSATPSRQQRHHQQNQHTNHYRPSSRSQQQQEYIEPSIKSYQTENDPWLQQNRSENNPRQQHVGQYYNAGPTTTFYQNENYNRVQDQNQQPQQHARRMTVLRDPNFHQVASKGQELAQQSGNRQPTGTVEHRLPQIQCGPQNNIKNPKQNINIQRGNIANVPQYDNQAVRPYFQSVQQQSQHQFDMNNYSSHHMNNNNNSNNSNHMIISGNNLHSSQQQVEQYNNSQMIDCDTQQVVLNANQHQSDMLYVPAVHNDFQRQPRTTAGVAKYDSGSQLIEYRSIHDVNGSRYPEYIENSGLFESSIDPAFGGEFYQDQACYFQANDQQQESSTTNQLARYNHLSEQQQYNPNGFVEFEETGKTYHLLGQPKATTNMSQPQLAQQNLNSQQQQFMVADQNGYYESAMEQSNSEDFWQNNYMAGSSATSSSNIPTVSRFYDPNVEISSSLMEDCDDEEEEEEVEEEEEEEDEDFDEDEEEEESQDECLSTSIQSSSRKSAARTSSIDNNTSNIKQGCSSETLEKLKLLLERRRFVGNTNRDQIPTDSSFDRINNKTNSNTNYHSVKQKQRDNNSIQNKHRSTYLATKNCRIHNEKAASGSAYSQSSSSSSSLNGSSVDETGNERNLNPNSDKTSSHSSSQASILKTINTATENRQLRNRTIIIHAAKPPHPNHEGRRQKSASNYSSSSSSSNSSGYAIETRSNKRRRRHNSNSSLEDS